ncbi:hypothetical protein IFR05_011196 [Cadophora sp. M221]|nr:hypothetical protein IFR05_011196 [Cadophora sp. M221]
MPPLRNHVADDARNTLVVGAITEEELWSYIYSEPSQEFALLHWQACASAVEGLTLLIKLPMKLSDNSRPQAKAMRL